ncbi:MAG: 3-oxoacyl-ACP reductase FabG [Clostridia bacterium]|jgi:3-oxoacyl-[acyl-carrier protein] reductase|nr:3-oxoacyl-ACP reductase FabG [Clostridia bacterium]
MKTALITGGTRGIGKAIALAFLQRGYEVVLNYRANQRAALATQEEFNILGYCPILLRADVSDELQVKNMFREFFSIYDKLDVLVNNAGVSSVKVIQDVTLGEWNKIFDTNVKSTFLCSREVTDKMVFAGGGSIINISSIWGEVGASCEVAYSASKGAVIAFTKALAKELAPSNVRVNCVSPGVIDTQMNSHLSPAELEELINCVPMGRIGQPSDVGEACVMLAESSYITGEVLSVGGGFGK